jgi:hypothetical protein
MNTSAEVLLVAIPTWVVIWSFIKYVLREHEKVAHRVRLRHAADNPEFVMLLEENKNGN